MQLMFSFTKTKKNKVGIVIDFAGSSIGGILFEAKEGEKMRMLISFRKPVNFLFETDLNASLRCAGESLRFVIKELKKFYPREIDFVVCVFSSPWFVSHAKTIIVTAEKPFEVKNEFFNNLIEEEEKKLSKNRKINSNFIEHEVMKADLNGYDVQNPIGKIANSVKSSIYVSAGVKKAMEKVKEEVEKSFNHASLSFATFPLVAFKVLGDIIDKKEEGFLIIDIGGEVTDICIVRNGALEQTVSFSIGYNLLIKKISSRMNTFFGESVSILKAYLREHLAIDELDKTTLAVSDSVKEWGDGFRKALSEISGESLLPQSALLMGDDLICKPFYSYVDSKDFSEFTIIRKPFIAKKIEQAWLKQYFDVADSFHYENNTMLTMGAVYAGVFLKNLKLK